MAPLMSTPLHVGNAMFMRNVAFVLTSFSELHVHVACMYIVRRVQKTNARVVVLVCNAFTVSEYGMNSTVHRSQRVRCQ